MALEIQARCDHCEDTATVPFPSKAELEAALEYMGWVHAGRRYYCPETDCHEFGRHHKAELADAREGRRMARAGVQTGRPATDERKEQ